MNRNDIIYTMAKTRIRERTNGKNYSKHALEKITLEEVKFCTEMYDKLVIQYSIKDVACIHCGFVSPINSIKGTYCPNCKKEQIEGKK